MIEGVTMRSLSVSGLIGVAVASMTYAAPVFAQTAASDQAGAREELEEIIVTARRREENLQSVPIAITAIDDTALRARTVQDPIDLQFMVPSLSITTGAGGSYTLRGLGQGFGGSAPAVVSYIDEVAQFTQVPQIQFFDLQNVQVLNGPQGTLFGRNTIGGAILFTSQRPTDTLEGYAQIRGGNYDLREAEGALNIPLIDDTLMLRVAGQSRQRDGYERNVITGVRSDDVGQQAGRVGLTWRPTESIE